MSYIYSTWLPLAMLLAGTGLTVRATSDLTSPKPASVVALADPPGNDRCEDAMPEALAVGGTLTFTGDNTEATFDGDAVEGTVMFQFPSPNTWHAFTTTGCADVTVSYCGTDAGWTNVWRLLSTDCPAENLVNASSFNQTDCPNGNWTFSFADLPAGTYYLPVPNVGFGQGGGPYNITVTAAACMNTAPDHCEDAVPEALAVGGTLTFTGDNTEATFDGDAVEGTVMFQFPSPNTWHAFTTTGCADVTVSYCGTDAGWTNVWRLLSTDCPAENLVNASSFNQTDCPNGNWTFSFADLPAGTYYLPVPNVGFGQGGGPYNITVTAAACMNTAPDHCEDAVPEALAVGGTLTFTGDNTEATFDGDAVEGNIMSEYPFPNTWHAFTTTGCADVTVSYCGTDAGWTNVWRLLSTDCPAENLVNASSFNQTDCPNGNWTFSFADLPAGTYYLPVPNVGFGQGGGPYNITVTAAACMNTAPDHCEDAVPEALAVGGTLTFTGDNTEATFDGDAVEGNIMSEYPFPNTWHAFTTTGCADVTVSYCGTDAGWTNVWRLLSTDCPAENLVNASSFNQTDCPNGNWTFSFADLPAGTYYLPVPNVGFGQGGGPYNITVTAAACMNTAPDHCEDAVPEALAVGGTLTFTGDNTEATFDGDAVEGNIMSEYPFPNTWHAFTTTGCADVTVNYCTTDSGWSNVWKLLSLDCPATTLVAPDRMDTTNCTNGNWTFAFDSLPAGTYYLPVPNVGFGQGGGAYSIQVDAGLCGTVGLAIGQEAKGDWILFPNPANGAVQIMVHRSIGASVIRVTDMAGRTVLKQNAVLLKGDTYRLPLSAVAPGIYQVVIEQAEGRQVKPLVIR